MFSDRIDWNPRDYAWDIETYPNVFTCTIRHIATSELYAFEVSERIDQIGQLCEFIRLLQSRDCRMVGFNNIGFDYPVLHFALQSYQQWGDVTAAAIYEKAMQLINKPFNDFSHIVWDDQQFVPQIDLYKIHHFDNRVKSTGLKAIEFNMRSANIGDLPYPVGTFLTPEQIPVLLDYNDHDVCETIKFYKHSIELIEFREQLSEKYNRNFLNHNDTKIGKDYFIMRLEEAIPGACYTRGPDGRRVPRQTQRYGIPVSSVVFPYIKFNHPEFQRVHQWLLQQVITDTKNAFSVSAAVDGFQFDFGTGGIHGSVSSQIVSSDASAIIIDLDVAGYYPSIAIVNRLYPEHLSETFCDIYADVKNERAKHKKGTAENKVMKLAGNGVYGDSNNEYSPFFDPQYTMTVTINGQLLLCMLAEYLLRIPGLQMIQANTDGITVKCPRDQLAALETVTDWWQRFTCLELERVEYSRMFIRDVNNYIAEKMDGKLKRKGAYCHALPWEKDHDLEWHQDHSGLVIQKAAEAALVHGADIDAFVRNHANPFDFLMRAKVTGHTKLVTTDVGGTDHPQQKVTRYYVAQIGEALNKLMPPLPGKTETRRIGINTGRNVFIANDASRIDLSNIDHSFYIEEARKLVDPLKGTR